MRSTIQNKLDFTVQFPTGQLRVIVNDGDSAKEVSNQLLKLSRYVKLLSEDFQLHVQEELKPEER